MNTVFFTSINDIRQYVKLNAALPWESFAPYLGTATDSFTERYITEEFIDAHSADATFMTLCRKVLAPLAVYHSADEMSISIGDSGITVQNDHEKRSPASDQKIAAAKRSLLQRSNAALSILLDYVLNHLPEDAGSLPLLKKVEGLAVPSLEVFERYVSIDSDHVTFFALVPMLRTIQNRLATMIGGDILSDCLMSSDATKKAIAGKIRAYCVYQCAYLNTSDSTRSERGRSGRTEWSPLIRPLYTDQAETGNWYHQVADETLSELRTMIDALDEGSSSDSDTDASIGMRGKHIYML